MPTFCAAFVATVSAICCRCAGSWNVETCVGAVLSAFAIAFCAACARCAGSVTLFVDTVDGVTVSFCLANLAVSAGAWSLFTENNELTAFVKLDIVEVKVTPCETLL